MLKLQPVAPQLKNRCAHALIEPAMLEPSGSRQRDKNKEMKSDSHVRQYIELDKNVLVINPLTCGQQYLKAGQVLGISKSTMEDLVDFRAAWDLDKNCIVQVEECVNPVFQGVALSKVIDELQIEESIEQILEAYLAKLTPKGVATELSRTGNGYALYGDYTVTFHTNNGEPLLKEEIEYIQNGMMKYADRGKLNRVNMLLNLMNAHNWNEDAVRRYLKEMLLVHNVVVIPYNLRPSLDGRKHPLTQAYGRLLQANTDVGMFLNGSVDDFKEHYRKIVNLVQTIMVNNVLENTDLKSLDPLLKRIKGKNGLIRGTMLKKRQDYSGRSAVIVDPFLPVNCLGIPKTMAVKLFRRYLTEYCDIPVEEIVDRMHEPDFVDKAMNALTKNGIFADVPILLGRNPTLHKHGIQGFYVKIVDGRAIRVNPLVCNAFNMDFDGDAAHTEIPTSVEAQWEIKRLIMTDKNIILPKTGKCTICPEKDVVYGLYICTSNYQGQGVSRSYANVDELKEALFNQKCYVWDNVTVGGQGSGRAGRIAFESCFPAKIAKRIEDKPMTQSAVKDCIQLIQGLTTETFDACVNKLLELGIRIAYIYSKSISVLKPLNQNEVFDNAIKQFNEEMVEIYELSDFGFYDKDSFEYDFSARVAKADKSLKDNILSKMPDNMFKDMAVSGARGSEGNLVQMFGSKGRIQKSEMEAFNILLENSMCGQLTPLNQAISAHGARRGQISKSIKTADTGYLGRRLNHCNGSIIIREDDCGTTKGITISFDKIRDRYITETMTQDDIPGLNKKAEETMVKFIVGKYRTVSNTLITEAEAKEIAKSHKSVEVRSPITCSNPCCAKCYGLYCETGRLPVNGLPVGLIAAVSMSEPSTQLVMKEFQKGGVVGAASPFDRLDALLCGSDIRQRAAQGEYPTYDPVAWASGILTQEDYSGSCVLLRIVPCEDGTSVADGDYSITRLAPKMAVYKVGELVSKGTTLRKAHGDVYIPEMVQYAGLEEAQVEMIYSLYFLFKSQVDLLPIHFEVTLSSCTGYMPVVSMSKNVKYGKYYTKRNLVDIGLSPDYDDSKYIAKICGVDKIVLGSPNFMEAFIMEDQREALSEAVLNCLYDVVNSPLVQLAIGQKVKVGTGYSETFVEDMY